MLNQHLEEIWGYYMVNFNDWHSIVEAYVCKDGVNKLSYAPDSQQLDFYYTVLKNYCRDRAGLILSETILPGEVFLLGIRGWEHDRPAPEYKNSYSDTLVVIYHNSDGKVDTFKITTRPWDHLGIQSLKGHPHLTSGIHRFQFDSRPNPGKLIPVKEVLIQYDSESKGHADHCEMVPDNSIHICSKSPIESNPYNGNQIIEDDGNDPSSFDRFLNLIETLHTKTKTIPVKDLTPRQLPLFTEQELADFVSNDIRQTQILEDIIYALIDAEDLMMYAEGTQAGGGD